MGTASAAGSSGVRAKSVEYAYMSRSRIQMESTPSSSQCPTGWA
ncbi:MAG: hypothetical protein ACOZNI_30635 [Myxococcota bacterium]